MTEHSLHSNIFDTFGGLPIHPLAVHGAVVLLPLCAIALATLIALPRWRKTFFPLTMLGLGLSVLFTFIAKESGEALAERVGEPKTHEALGSILFPASLGLFALGITFFALQRTSRPKWQLQLAALFVIAGVISVATLTYFVGHTGAEATWANRVAPYQPAPSETTSDEVETSTGTVFTLAEISKHSTREDCWTTIDGLVYDLTPYMKQHPGGAASLAWLCGIDGSELFASQHGTERRPAEELASLQIGTLKVD